MTLSRSGDFFQELKRITEANWKTKSINPAGYGFQFQPGTRWNRGLSDDAIAEYEGVLGVEFPHDFKAFLRVMNGTDLPTINIYGSCGEPERQSVGVYCYPRDIELVQQRMADVRKVRTQVVADLAEQGFGLPDDAGPCADLYSSICDVHTRPGE
jgi:hypothetical protein